MRNGRPESVAESQEMGDGEKGDRSLESGDGSWEMGDERWETVDRSQETGDMSRETEGRSRETGDWVWGLVCMSPHAPMYVGNSRHNKSDLELQQKVAYSDTVPASPRFESPRVIAMFTE